MFFAVKFANMSLLACQQGDLVEYYYTWKKTPSALSSRPHRRRRHNVLRRKALPRTSKSIVSEFGKYCLLPQVFCVGYVMAQEFW